VIVDWVDCKPCQRIQPELRSAPISKDTASCCTSKRDSLGRLPIGYCGPECERRPK
jgi:hypothetical protein